MPVSPVLNLRILMCTFYVGREVPRLENFEEVPERRAGGSLPTDCVLERPLLR